MTRMYHGCVCVRVQLTLWALGYATLLVSEFGPWVRGEAPRADAGVVWVTTEVLSEVLLPESFRHETVGSGAAVTQTVRWTKTGRQKIQLACRATCSLKNTQRWQRLLSVSLYTSLTEWEIICSFARRLLLSWNVPVNVWKLTCAKVIDGQTKGFVLICGSNVIFQCVFTVHSGSGLMENWLMPSTSEQHMAAVTNCYDGHIVQWTVKLCFSTWWWKDKEVFQWSG